MRNGMLIGCHPKLDQNDLDYITINNFKFKQKDIDCMNFIHEKEFERLNLSLKQLINNPENHFYFYGMKILSIHILKKFKYNRTKNIVNGQKNIRIKDINDYNMLVKFLK